MTNTTEDVNAVPEAGSAGPLRKTTPRKGRRGKKTSADAGGARNGKTGRSQADAKPAPRKKDRPAIVPREFSKTAAIVDLLRRKNGATAAEIANLTGWQAHSIRGFISGKVTKRMGMTVESTKNKGGERTYRIQTK